MMQDWVQPQIGYGSVSWTKVITSPSSHEGNAVAPRNLGLCNPGGWHG
jgi:hypothetical protein